MAYPSLSIGAPRRLAQFRRIATLPKQTWRTVRFPTLKSHSGLSQCPDGWYSHDGAEFRNERFCDEVIPRIRHRGWFGDTENQERTYRGIVARIPHGRFIAGYLSEDNSERVYFPMVFTESDDAARMSDEHARIAAEREDEYSQRFNEAMRLEGLIEDIGRDIDKAYALRNHPRLADREWIHSRIEDVRAFRRERESMGV